MICRGALEDQINNHKKNSEARRDALALMAADPGLALPQHATLRQRMLLRYGKALDLGDVG